MEEMKKELIPHYGMEKETTIFNEDGSSYRVRIEIMWDKGKTMDGFKLLIAQAKEMLDSMGNNR